MYVGLINIVHNEVLKNDNFQIYIYIYLII